NHPQLVLFVPMHRIFVAQPAIIRIGIGDDFRSEHVVLKRAAHDRPSFHLISLISLPAVSMRRRAGTFQLDCECVRQPLLVASCRVNENAGSGGGPIQILPGRYGVCVAQLLGQCTTVVTDLTRDFAPPLIAEMETGSCAGSTPIGTSPFTAKARPGRANG